MKNFQRNGNITGRKDASGGVHWFGVDIFMHRCGYLRSGSGQVFGGVSFVWKDLVGIAILT